MCEDSLVLARGGRTLSSKFELASAGLIAQLKVKCWLRRLLLFERLVRLFVGFLGLKALLSFQVRFSAGQPL
jgi:hypothetical protein